MSSMNPQQRQAGLIGRYANIPDPHERLAAVVSRRPGVPPLAPEERTEANRVHGCQSRIWIAGLFENGRCRFAMEAESALVRGLAGLLCEIYHDGTPEEIVALEPEIFEALGLTGHLSPTRLSGLAGVRERLRAFAAEHLASR